MENIKNMEAPNICIYCNNNAEQKCSRCYSVYYCSKECQSSHYKTHKLICKPPFRIKEISGKGKGMVADKYIAVGSLILSEKPILITDVITDLKDIARHVDTLRDLVAKLEPKKKRQLFSLYNAREDLQVLGLFGSNSIKLPTSTDMNDGSAINKPRAAVFPTLSRINHSCVPNVVWSWNDTKQQEELRAMVDIEPDTEMTASYIDIMLPSMERQDELSYKYCFICHCSLCSLPSKELHVSDYQRKEVSRLQREIGEMVKQENFIDAFQKGKEVLKLGLDLGNQAYSILPQMYLNCYQLCRKAQKGNDVEENEAVDFYETGLAWATKLRGNNTVFSKLDSPTSNFN